MNGSKSYYTAIDISGILGVSRAKAYQIIKMLNEELHARGYIVLSGKVSKAFFDERWYGGSNSEKVLKDKVESVI